MIDFPAEVPADFDLKKYFGNAWGVYQRRQGPMTWKSLSAPKQLPS